MAKLFANLDKLKNIPTPPIVKAKSSINQGQGPIINTSVPTGISLADRLLQSKRSNTNHLPQFFLSDVYTGFIKVSYPPATVEQGSITIKPFNFTPNQGSVTLVPLKFTPNQGVGVTPTKPSTSVFLKQGLTYTGIDYVSQIKIVNPTSTTKVNQGPGVIPILMKTDQYGAYLTPPGFTIPKPPPDGYVRDPNIAITFPKNDYISYPTILGLSTFIVDGDAYLTIPEILSPVSNGLGVTIPIMNVPLFDETGVRAPLMTKTDWAKLMHPLKISAFLADKALSVFAPQIKHGSQTPQNKSANTNTKNSFLITDSENKAINDTLLQDGGKWDGSAASRTIENYSKVGTLENMVGNDYKYTRELTTSIATANNEDVVGYLTNGIGAEQFGRLKFENILNRVNKSEQTKSPFYTPFQPSSVKNYSELIGEIEARRAISLENLDAAFADIVNKISGSTLTGLKGNETIITVSRYGGRSITFTAFLTSLSDSTNVAYQDYNYIGKQDTFKSYKGTTRQLSIGFKAIALGNTTNERFKRSSKDAKELAANVNQLIQIAAIGHVGANTYTEGPFIQFSLTGLNGNGLYKVVPAVVNSVKVDISATETPWDISTTLPMYYDISMDMAILGTQESTLFNDNKTFIGYE